jgi:hypothetical protein
MANVIGPVGALGASDMLDASGAVFFEGAYPQLGQLSETLEARIALLLNAINASPNIPAAPSGAVVVLPGISPTGPGPSDPGSVAVPNGR